MMDAAPTPQDTPPPGEDSSPPARFWLIAIIASLGGLLFGYDTGIIAGALLCIRAEFGISELMEGIIAGAALIGAIIGVLLGGPLADRIGRRMLIMICAMLFILSSVACALAPSISLLVVGRMLVGMAVGIASMVTPIYLAEISPPAQRGTVVSLNSLCIVGGMFGSYLLSWAMIDWADNWRWMLGFGVLPGFILALGILLLPASPRWLAAQGRFAEARDVLNSMRPEDAVEAELRLLRRDARKNRQAETASGWSSLFTPPFRKVVLTGILLAFFQQASGINAVLYFAPRIFQQAGANTPALAILATAAVGFVNVIFTLVALWLVDHAGRRILLLWGLAGMNLLLAVLALGSWIGISSLWFAAACLCGFIAAFAVSLGSVYYVLVSEIFPQNIRSMAMSLAAGTVWCTNLVVTIFFPTLNEALGNAGSFLIFTVIGVLAFIFTLRYIPETRGHTLEEIGSLFTPRS